MTKLGKTYKVVDTLKQAEKLVKKGYIIIDDSKGYTLEVIKWKS